MLDKATKVHLIGIGGYGMSALAKLLLEMGYKVSGSDLIPSDITRHLMEMGAEISIGHHQDNVKGRDLIVYSTAIPEENEELRAARKMGKVLHRSELLATLLNTCKGIAITGAHGKTTTTTMLALMMERGQLDPTALVGGEVRDFCGTARLGSGNYVVAEADESDQSFSRYRPWGAIVTNIEPDHLEHYQGEFSQLLEGYGGFLANIRPEGFVVIPAQDQWVKKIIHRARCRIITFGTSTGEYAATEVHLAGQGSSFCLCKGGIRLGRLALQVPGHHNILNATAAAAAALELGVDMVAIAATLAEFRGAKRRFEILLDQPALVVDDYAHHPTEIRATLAAARQVGEGRVVAVFQPHRYTRTRYFLDEFAAAFAAADQVVIDEIYAASEQPLPGITAAELARRTAAHHPGRVVQIAGLDNITRFLAQDWQPGDIIVTMGAGDIWRVSHNLAKIIKAGNCRDCPS